MPKTPRSMDVEKLIILVQDRPCIWDLRAADYQDRYKKDEAWVEISKELFSSIWAQTHGKSRQNLIDEVRNRWRSCRDQFRKEMRHQGRSGSGPPKKRPYIYKEQLMFLRAVMGLRPTEDNLAEDPEDSAPMLSSACEEDPSQQKDTGATEAGPSTSAPTHPTTSGPESPVPLARLTRSRRRAVPPAETHVNTQVLDYLARSRHEDEHDLFGRSIAPFLRRLPPDRLLRTRRIVETVLEAASPPNDPRDLFEVIENFTQHGSLWGPPSRPLSQSTHAPPPGQTNPDLYGPPRPQYPPSYPSQTMYGPNFQPSSQPGPSQSQTTTSQPPQATYTGPQFHYPPSPSGRYMNL